MRLFGAAIFALFVGTALSARATARHSSPVLPARHQMGINPPRQARHPLTQGFLCDWCIVGVEDGQAAVRNNMDQILAILGRVSALCAYCPVADQCNEVFQTDIPAAINEFLNESPSDICTDATLCDANATVQGMVMNSLRGDFARDRVIKRMLMRARVMQQRMIRIILGDDYMCTSCLDFVAVARETLLNNETQHEIMDFLAPLCAYLPDVYQTDCNDFVQGLPELLTMVANDVLTDSLCAEIGFCNQTKSTPDLSSTLPDVISRLGLPGVLPVMPDSQNPFQFPGGGDRQNPFQIPGRGRIPYGYPSRPRQYPSQSRPGNGRYPFQFPSNTRPQQPAPIRPKWQGSTNPRPSKPQKPQDPFANDQIQIPDLNLDDLLGTAEGIMGRLPSLPEIPDVSLPEIPDVSLPDMNLPDIDIPRLPISIPGNRGQKGQSKRHRGKKGKGHQRRQRSLGDWMDTADRFLGQAKDTVREYYPYIPDEFIPGGLPKDTPLEYIPDSIPEAGINIIENGADENCELCKVAVTAASTWLEENGPKLQKMVSKLVLPVCKVFPSPMKEDCSSDMRDFVQTVIERLHALLQPEPVCTHFGICVAPEAGEEFYPTTEYVVPTDAVEVPPATDASRFDWPIPLVNRFKDLKIKL